MSLCVSWGLRAPFSLGPGPARLRIGYRFGVMGSLLWLCGQLPVQADPLPATPPEVTLNAVQRDDGLSLAPTLLSKHEQALYFRLDLWSQSAAGKSHQQQRGQLVLAAKRPHGLGRITLGLACPYEVRIRLQLWQEGRLLSETEQPLRCDASP